MTEDITAFMFPFFDVFLMVAVGHEETVCASVARLVWGFSAQQLLKIHPNINSNKQYNSILKKSQEYCDSSQLFNMT